MSGRECGSRRRQRSAFAQFRSGPGFPGCCTNESAETSSRREATAQCAGSIGGSSAQALARSK